MLHSHSMVLLILLERLRCVLIVQTPNALHELDVIIVNFAHCLAKKKEAIVSLCDMIENRRDNTYCLVHWAQ